MTRVISLGLLLAAPVLAQAPLTEHTFTRTDTLARAPATLDDMSWLVGSWRGPGLGGTTDEVWLPPVGGSMLGMFRLSHDGAPSFYELCAMREIEGSLQIDLKHFNPDMTGWEARDERVQFPLIRVDGHRAYFEGLTYHLVDPDTLQIWVAIRNGDEVSEASFTLHRQPVAL